MDFTLPEELKQLKLLVRRFVQEELLPLEEEVEARGGVPEETRQRLRRKARDLGLWALRAPAEYGGGGISTLGELLVYEELGKVRSVLGVTGFIVGDDRCMPFISIATEDQKRKYFIPVIRGEKESCIALTEPDAGSDVRGIKTRAIKSYDHFLINGRKRFITDADRAHFALVYAVTDREKLAISSRGITCFMVDRDAPGFVLERRIPVLDRGTATFEIVLENCIVPAGNVLGGIDEGLPVAIKQVALFRNRLSAGLVGTTERLLEMSKNYAKQRETFGKPLSERQAIQWMLADMALYLYAARLMMYDVAWKFDRGLDPRTETYMFKLHTEQMAFRAADYAMQIHGGIGYTRDFPIGRLWEEVRLMRIAEGGDEIMKMMIARSLLRGTDD